jgi:hypothetical protein
MSTFGRTDWPIAGCLSARGCGMVIRGNLEEQGLIVLVPELGRTKWITSSTDLTNLSHVMTSTKYPLAPARNAAVRSFSR